MAYGLTPTGFVAKPLDVILDELGAKQRATISPNLNTDPKTPIGQLNGIIGLVARELWEKLADVDNGMDPDVNADDAQDAVAAITGTTRKGPARSTIPVRLSLNASATVPVGSVVAQGLGGGVADPIHRFVTTAPVTNTTGAARTFDVVLQGVEVGPLFASAGPLIIVTPASGWTGARALVDATRGRLAESNEELRLRRERELRTPGSGTQPGLYTALSGLDTVISVAVYENESHLFDADGRPPHSIECVVLGGEDLEIATLIWRNKSTGAQTYGNVAVEIIDSQGQTRAIRFSRPRPVPVWLAIDLAVLPGYPSDGDEKVATHLETWAAGAMEVGVDVVRSRISAEVFKAVPVGIEDVVAIRVGTANPPTGATNLTIDPRELAQIARARIVVNHA